LEQYWDNWLKEDQREHFRVQARAAIEEIEKGGEPCGVCGYLIYKGLPT
jgi:hypothetical protein